MGRRSSVPQVGPARWNFIRSPIPRQPYSHIRKLYEIELQNSKSNRISDLDKDEIAKIREKTRLILKQKQQKETIQSIIFLIVIIGLASILLYFLL